MNATVQPLIHLDHLGMQHNPFPVAPDASNYFISENMQKHLVEMLHCIDARMGFALIIGEVGIGKSTLSRYLLKQLDAQEISTAIVLNTFLQGESLIGAINRDYGIDDVAGMEQKIAALNTFLLDHFRQGKNCVIMIDDAQNLSLESLELVRQISNLETEQEKMVQIILIAQPEILVTLDRCDIRQLKSRIALTVRLPNMNRHDLKAYVRFRLNHAGNDMNIHLSAWGLRALQKETSGFPRRVNLIMDRCLYVVAAYGKNRINASLVRKAAKELRIAPPNLSRLLLRYTMMATLTAMVAMLVWKPAILWPDDHSWHDFQRYALEALHLAPYLASHGIQQELTVAMPANDTGKQSATVVPAQIADTKPQNDQQMNDQQQKLQQMRDQQDLKIQHFLAFYGLEDQRDEFLQARDSQTLDGKILNPGGWQALVKNYRIASDKAHEVLTYTEADGLQRWVTLWKPLMAFKHFYYFMQAPDVVVLQHMLARLGFYPFPVDNIVGRHALEGVRGFQEMVGLSATGFPDVYTLYVMQRKFDALNDDDDSEQPGLIPVSPVAGTLINTASTK